MLRISEDQFEAMVGEALDSLPEEFAALLDNVAVVVEEEPDAEILRQFEMDPENPEDGELFGLYQGISQAERDVYYSALPDRIAIYRGPILRFCRSRREVLGEVRDTVIHELGHHFGLDEDDMPY